MGVNRIATRLGSIPPPSVAGTTTTGCRILGSLCVAVQDFSVWVKKFTPVDKVMKLSGHDGKMGQVVCVDCG